MNKLTRCAAPLCGEVIAEGDRRYPAYCAGCYLDLEAALAAEREKRLEAESKVRKLREAIKEFSDEYSETGYAAIVYGLKCIRLALTETADKEG